MLLVVSVVAVAALFLIHFNRALIYDLVIVKMTAQWYQRVLSRLPQNSLLLDVGIGTGTALLRNEVLNC